ncbi:hypothetical protein O181_034196 [Austropuccinia psidii MF-1]|uniref:Uncharacterized protein n=1 Tax=Austropuccinia psidii MF-1 TaxID=1389203 RepID=A0A9Q3D5W2_9BASI|nr:hypothetical protein [Austropuccinia psidii MF-1]
MNSTTESWDSDPDIILPDGPLTLLQSDTENETESTNSSISFNFQQSKLINSNPNHTHNHLDHLENQTHDQFDLDNLNQSNQSDTLKLKIISKKSLSIFDSFNQSTISSSDQDQEIQMAQDSFDSKFSIDQQSTIKPNSTTISKFQNLSIDSNLIKSFLTNDSKNMGTITKLQSNKKSNLIQNPGFDWDEDLILPQDENFITNKFKTHLNNHQNQIENLKQKSSFSSEISQELLDEIDIDEMDHHHPKTKLESINVLNHKKSFKTIQEEDNFENDFQLPSSDQSLDWIHQPNKSTPLKKLSSKPNSIISLTTTTSSDLDFVDDLPIDSLKSSTSDLNSSSKKLNGFKNRSGSNSISSVRINDPTQKQKIRTRPSFTPSLMSDRSSSPFTEIDDDLAEGFFDDIEFPPEFGIPNNLNQLKPNSNLNNHLQPNQSISNQSSNQNQNSSSIGSIDLQNYLKSKVQARAIAIQHPNPTIIPSNPSSLPASSSSSASTILVAPSRTNSSNSVSKLAHFRSRHEPYSRLNPQVRQTIRLYKDKHDEKFEDGLEIQIGSIHSEKLKGKKSTSFNSISNQSYHSNYVQKLSDSAGPSSSSSNLTFSNQSSKLSRITVPFPTTTNNSSSNLHQSSSTSSVSKSLSKRPSTTHLSLLNRPNSALLPSASTPKAPIQLPHRPLSVLALLSNDHCIGSSNSKSSSRSRAKSLRLSNSNSGLKATAQAYSTSTNPSNFDSSNRVQSPSGANLKKSARSNGKSSNLNIRSKTPTASSSQHIGPPVISASNHRTLKHKKSAVALKSSSQVSSSSNHPHTNHNNILSSTDITSSLTSTPPTSFMSLNGRDLQRKQSMPTLNHENNHNSNFGTQIRFGVGSTSNNTSTNWKSHGAVPRPKSRQQLQPLTSHSSLIGHNHSTSVLPSYADPTQASIKKQVINSVSSFSSISSSGVTKKESCRQNTSSPMMGLQSTLNGTNIVSRLTMSTIASRLKAKPSVIHEDHSDVGLKRWKSAGTTIRAPQHLRRPRRLRSYGDGTELDEFDDLPTNKEKEKMFTRVVKIGSNSRLSTKMNNLSNNEFKDANLTTTVPSKSRGRLDARKADGIKKRRMAMNNKAKGEELGQVGKVSTKKGLIRQMSKNTIGKTSNNSEMKWNEKEARWEGNEQVLREFDNVLSSSARPALISQFSIQSPRIKSSSNAEVSEIGGKVGINLNGLIKNKSQNHIVGGMVFDAESMCWRKVQGGDDEDELRLESDEELELRWLADDEKSCGGMMNDKEKQWNLKFDDENDPEDEHQAQEQVEGKGLKGRFWEECIEAEARHRREISSWIVESNSKDNQAQGEDDEVGHESATENNENQSKVARLKKNKSISIASNHHRLNCHSPLLTSSHSYGNLNDPDRYYLQEIRKLVLEEHEEK